MAARARSRASCGGGERARRCESTYAELVDMMSRIVAYNRLRDGSLENATCARGTGGAKLNEWRGKSRISIVQSIQLGFSRSLGSTTSHEANKSAMLRAEWLRLAQMKHRYFVPERCKENSIFSGTSHQNRSYLDNVSTNR